MNVLKIVALMSVILVATAGAITTAFATTIADLFSFAGLFVLTTALGLASGVSTLYLNDKCLGLLRSEPWDKSDWFRVGLMVGFDMVVLSVVIPVVSQATSPAAQESLFWTVGPLVAAFALPVVWFGVGYLMIGVISSFERMSASAWSTKEEGILALPVIPPFLARATQSDDFGPLGRTSLWVPT